MLKRITLFFISIISLSLQAQTPEKLSSNQIYERIQKLNFLGKVLYVAAHPDDENTKLISYFSNYYHAETAYLSLTRGDGGQNLIGPELREKLGAIRTQELLAARRVDGGKQFFTRANDFGFSKEPTETFSIWNKDQVLSDVVQAMENFKPDIVINRFDHRTPGTTHGHHTASAILSLEAYNKISVKPQRVFFNTSWWFYGSEENFEKADKSNLLAIEANVYYPLKGKSNSEIAALSRSQHKCQGFGTTGTRGNEPEYLELLKGTMPNADDIFEGIDTSWNRIEGGAAIEAILKPIEEHFNFNNPAEHLPQLIKAYTLINQLKDDSWKKLKSEQITSIIEACSGLYLEAKASVPYITKGQTFSLNVEAINRSHAKIELKEIQLPNGNFPQNRTLATNEKNDITLENYTLPTNEAYSNLFWLNEKPTVGMYVVPDKAERNLPEIKTPFPITFLLNIDGIPFSVTENIKYKTNTPENGETYYPFALLPDVSVSLVDNVNIFKPKQTKEIKVKVKANKADFKGTLELDLNSDWSVYPSHQEVNIAQKGDEKIYTFKVKSPSDEQNTSLLAKVITDNQTFSKQIIEINYPHIPKQTILEDAEAKMVTLDIKTKKESIGYLTGAGDEVGRYLENLNYTITYLTPKDLTLENLKQFDAIILGIRAFNVVPELQYKNKVLFEYVENGGNLIVQYNTNHHLVTPEIAPYSLNLSRDRVTNENARMNFLDFKCTALNSPNTITQKDFDGWVQERGLYFPNEWGSEFQPILATADTGETEKKGCLLVAKYGKGNYCYTGLSFFRQLPEGVSGAYKLLANLIAL
ncbi:PIG-L family deacetylase [Flavobacterium sp. NRK F10]|uniref:PIG-L family deacetylase n=1 Tax=Flavobacterium sp. NRK F10 TaxID=2954931 RepID=UPI002090D483|nr:PIG-L family deacetylase [Flavobacterium sp. NRK F10]MCO6173467.1 PIG-L family deacetylase [Flavobacterium sp. NRK F10]